MTNHRCLASISGTHVVADPRSVRWGVLPTVTERPVVTVGSGDVITFDTVSHEGFMEDQGHDPVGFFAQWGIGANEVLDDVRALAEAGLDHPAGTGPHVVLGPVAVAGARPGDVLAVDMLALTPRVPYGVISNRHGRGVLAGEHPRPGDDGCPPPVVSVLARVDADGRTGHIEAANGRRLRFPLGPFLGLVGVTPAAATPHSSTPPGPFGGNLDVRHLTIGSRLFLPVQVDGAGLYVGDPHYAQGNGEVALTAFEAPLRATMRVEVLRDDRSRQLAHRLAHPWADAGPNLLAIGLGATVDEALRASTRHALALIGHLTGADETSALAFCSAAVDFEVSQAVNGVVGVHAVMRKADLGV